MPEEHKTTEARNPSGQVTAKSIQGRAFDPEGKLAVQEKMRQGLGSLGTGPRKPERGAYSSEEAYQMAMKAYESRMAQKKATQGGQR